MEDDYWLIIVHRINLWRLHLFARFCVGNWNPATHGRWCCRCQCGDGQKNPQNWPMYMSTGSFIPGYPHKNPQKMGLDILNFGLSQIFHGWPRAGRRTWAACQGTNLSGFPWPLAHLRHTLEIRVGNWNSHFSSHNPNNTSMLVSLSPKCSFHHFSPSCLDHATT